MMLWIAQEKQLFIGMKLFLASPIGLLKAQPPS
jgi:hypothetical protein